MSKPWCSGSWVALVTPMTASGQIDLPSLKALLQWHCMAQTRGIVLLGTTGEAPTLSLKEKQQLIDVAQDTLAGRLPLVVGVGGNDTATVCRNAKMVEDLGADGLLVVTPYYNRPPQAGLVAHFKAVANASALPVLLYDVPARTGVSLEMETLQALYEEPTIVGIKDASGHLGRVLPLRYCFPKWSLLTGNDDQLASFMRLGGHGVVSVSANVVPDRIAKVCDLFLKGDIEAGCQMAASLRGLHKALFAQSNPIPVKWALAAMGKIEGGIRLPLLPLADTHHVRVRQALVDLSLMEDEV